MEAHSKILTVVFIKAYPVSLLYLLYIKSYFWMLDQSDKCEKEHVAVHNYPPTSAPQ